MASSIGKVSCNRRGMVLITVLYLMVAVSALVLTCQLQARDRLRLSSNVDARIRAEWIAEGCAAVIQWSATRVLKDSSKRAQGEEAAWRRLDERMGASAHTQTADCRWSLTPAGVRLSVNDADEARIAEALTASGILDVQTAAASLADWIDADDIERPHGAEAAWYRSRRRLAPGNRPLQSVGELRMVRGLEGLTHPERLLGAEVEPVNAFHASAAVLRLLPGASEELVARILDTRERRGSLPELEDLAQGLSFDARRTFDAEFLNLKARYAREPYAWELDLSVGSERGGAGVRLRQRFTRSGVRLAVQQEWRGWL